MAYDSTGNPVRKAVDLGITSAGSIWIYESTHAHADIESTAGGGFFKGAGFGSPGLGSVGMRVGDLLVNINQSTAGSSAISWHRITSISTSTGFGSKLNAAVSVASS